MGLGLLSDRLREIGIRQEGDPILRRPCAEFDLPREADKARELRARLLDRIDLIHSVYPFVKGVGLAAPQIGVARAMAVVVPPDGAPITLINPVVVGESADRDQKFEGCLSFFEVRGLVSRPLSMDIAHTGWDGRRRIITVDRGLARLAAHEIDHLEGTLYLDRLPATRPPVALRDYDGTGVSWQY